MKQARLSLIKTLGVKRMGKPEVFVIKMMAELMEQGSEEGAKGSDLFQLGGAHPDSNHGRSFSIGWIIQSVELTIGIVRPYSEHLYLNRRSFQTCCE